MKRTTFVLAAGALAALAANGPASAQEPSYPYHMMWGGGWFMGPFMMLIFLAVVIAVVVLLVRWLGDGHASGNAGGNVKSATAILEERYARGEIDREEFEEKKRVLGGL